MSRPAFGVALIGYGFMGAVHPQAWRVVPRFFDLPVEPRMSVVVDRARVEAAGSSWIAVRHHDGDTSELHQQ